MIVTLSADAIFLVITPHNIGTAPCRMPSTRRLGRTNTRVLMEVPSASSTRSVSSLAVALLWSTACNAPSEQQMAIDCHQSFECSKMSPRVSLASSEHTATRALSSAQHLCVDVLLLMTRSWGILPSPVNQQRRMDPLRFAHALIATTHLLQYQFLLIFFSFI
jgi:hypothetical protein